MEKKKTKAENLDKKKDNKVAKKTGGSVTSKDSSLKKTVTKTEKSVLSARKKPANDKANAVADKSSDSASNKIIALMMTVFLVIVIFTAYFVFFIPQGFINVGMNISQNNYYTRQLMFNDLFKTATRISTQGTNESNAFPLDENGYPTEVPFEGKRGYFLVNNFYEGEYVFLYDGDGEFSFSGGIEKISEIGNAIELKLTSHNNHRLVYINRSNKDNPAKNFRFIPKEYYLSGERKMPLFRKDFLDGLKNMHVLRFMDAIMINGSNQTNWSDRALTTEFSTHGKGVPYEYLIELCNITGINGWFNVPHKASDDYILNLATLIEKNLNKRLKCYIEYSNETWNYSFEQATYINNNAPDHPDKYVSEDLNKISEPNGWHQRKTAYMAARTHRIFESVFANGDRRRLVTVGAIHTGAWINDTLDTIKYWQANDNLPDVIAGTAYFGYETSHWNYEALKDVLPIEKAEDLNSYFHNLWNADPESVTADDIIDAVELIWEHTIEPNARLSAEAIVESGAKFVVYEGGQHMQPHNQGVWDYNQAVWDAQISPRMYDLYMKNLKLHADLQCSLFVNFSYVSVRESQYGSWGVLENQADVYAKSLKSVAPKYKAIVDANKRQGIK